MNDYYITDVKRQRVLLVLQQRLLSYCVPTLRQSSFHPKRSLIDEEIETYVYSISSSLQNFGSLDHDRLDPTNCSADHDYPVLRNMQNYCDEMEPSLIVTPRELLTLYSAFFPNFLLGGYGTETSRLSRQKSTSSAGSARSTIFRPIRSSKIMFDIGNSFLDEDTLSDIVPLENEEIHSSGQEIEDDVADVNLDSDWLDRLRLVMLEIQRDFAVSTSCEVTEESWDQIGIGQAELTLVSEHADINPAKEDTPSGIVFAAVQYLVKNFEPDIRRLVVPHSKQTCYFSPQSSPYRRPLASSCVPSATLNNEESSSPLLRMLSKVARKCFIQRQYQSSELLYEAHEILQKQINSVQAIDDFSPLIYELCREQEELITTEQDIFMSRIPEVAHAKDSRSIICQVMDNYIYHSNKARLRMWYLHDIKPSKSWLQSWEVVKCLHKMYLLESFSSEREAGGSSTEGANPYHLQSQKTLLRSESRERRLPRFPRELRQPLPGANLVSGITAFDPAILDILSVPRDQGGPNKLATQQTQQTLQWLQESDVHNFCLGEERIHRLCYELDDLVRRTLKTPSTAVSTMDTEEAASSAIWSMELFKYEARIFKIGKFKRSISPRDLAVSSSDEHVFGGLLRRGSAGDLLNMTKGGLRARGNSLSSIEHPRGHLKQRVNSATNANFPGQLQSRGDSAIVSDDHAPIALHRRPSATSSEEKNTDDSGTDAQAMKDFLLQTQIGLVSLLISDFAELLFSDGSETDHWLNDDLAEIPVLSVPSTTAKFEKNASERGRFSVEDADVSVILPKQPKHDHFMKKHGRTKSNMSHLFTGSGLPRDNLKSTPAPPSIDMGSSASYSGLPMERTNSSGSYLDMSGSADTATTPVTPLKSNQMRSGQRQQFPLNQAYREVLLRLSVHPSPYEKLRALYDFELLIVASLTSCSTEYGKAPSRLTSSMPQSPMVQLSKSSPCAVTSSAKVKHQVANDLDEVGMARLEKATNALKPTFRLIPNDSFFSQEKSSHKPSTDTIVEEIQKVLKTNGYRPRTLFRDLQFIAAFIPTNILNMTDEGKVFWDFSLAALGVKRDAVDLMVQWASAILHTHDGQGSTTDPTTMDKPSASHTNAHLEESSMSDALRLFTIAAKERDVVAMRQLAMLQADRPELLTKLAIPPFSLPSDIFAKPQTTYMRRPYTAPMPSTAPEKTSSLRLAASDAWFELAASAGDTIAKERLTARQNSTTTH